VIANRRQRQLILRRLAAGGRRPPSPIGDYQEQLRRHALGKFRDLLRVTATHPAMLRYLDNSENAKGHINENYAREIMEFTT
jgi:Protein of unknown function (DUF1800)